MDWAGLIVAVIAATAVVAYRREVTRELRAIRRDLDRLATGRPMLRDPEPEPPPDEVPG